MLQLLVDGMKDNPDYYLYKRHQVFELTLSYHNSPVSDQHSQVRFRNKMVLEKGRVSTQVLQRRSRSATPTNNHDIQQSG